MSQNFPFTFMNSFRIILFLFFVIEGCTHFGLKNKSPSPSNIDIERSYFQNGNIEYEAQYINDKLDGISRVWLEDGILISESEYSNGQPHGIWMQYHLNNSIKYKVNYEYGEKTGFEKWFYENGQIQSKQTFIRGKPETEIIRWKPDGTLVY